MSLVVQRFLICDTEDCDNSTIDGNLNYPNGFLLRIAARNSGWHVGPKQDLCPDCAYKAHGE